jgi:hypothetical protein
MKFDIGTVLSISHDKLLTSIDNVYKILNYMLDDNLYTHQLPRAGRFCQKFVITEHPQLEKWDDFNEQITTENWEDFVEKAKAMFGDELEISKVPSGVWTYKEPVEEAEEIMPKENIIVLENHTTNPNQNN